MLEMISMKLKSYKPIIFILVLAITLLASTNIVLANDFGQYSDDDIKEFIEYNSRLNRNGQVEYSNAINKILKENPYKEELNNNHSVEIMVDGTPHMIYMSDDAYKEIIRTITKSKSRERVQSKVDDMGYSFNVQADIEGGAMALSGLEGIVGIFVGLLCYLIVIGMMLFTTFDVMYITIPWFKRSADNMVQSGNSIMTKTNGKTGEVGLRWVTDDAQYAVATATIESGKHPLAIYLGKRIWSYVILAIVLYILLDGNIQLIVNIVIKLIGGLMGVLEGLA